MMGYILGGCRTHESSIMGEDRLGSYRLSI